MNMMKAFTTIMTMKIILFCSLLPTFSVGFQKFPLQMPLAPQASPSTKLLISQASRTTALQLPTVGDLEKSGGYILNEEGKVILKNLRLNEMHEFMEMIGEGSGRSIQIWKWLYSKGRWIENLEQASGGGLRDALGKEIRQKLEEVATVDSGLKFDSVVQAGDGTRKMIFEVTAGNAKTKSVETVIIPMKGGKIKSDRYTICVSSQVGCAMNCQFCYTGRLGLLGNLMTSQIVEQVVQAKRYLKSIDDETPVSHIVFMGMGEPFDNYRAVMGAVAILSEPSHGGLQFDARKITVSTVGLVDRIRQFRQESKAQLAVSLHAPTDEIRDRIVPLNKRHDLKELLGTLRELYPESRPDGRRARDFVVFEYTMLGGVNDREADARRLLEVTRGINCIFNLITFNTHQESVFQSTPREQTRRFRQILLEGGRICTIRDSRGDDNMSACGQLGDIKTTERIIKAKPFQQNTSSSPSSFP